MNFLKNFKIMEVGAPIAAANNTDSNSDRIDMAGWDGVCFIGSITDSVATGVATLTAEQNIADSDTGMAALSGGAATATCAVNDDLNDQLLVVDIYKPQERYVQAVRTSATANIAFGTLIAILYRNRKQPITEDSTILDSVLAVSPAEA
ncbi:MAG: hypothetical protein ABIA75_09380 [Candidatus Neomarinimicrobiota bacterium]